MIKEFIDKSPGDHHWAFQEWRLENPDGFYMAQKAKGRYLLHHTGCYHVGSPFWDGAKDDSVSSSTANGKICSSSQTLLIQRVKELQSTFEICSHCIDASSPQALSGSVSAKKRALDWVSELVEWQKEHPNETWHADKDDVRPIKDVTWMFQEEVPAEIPLTEGALQMVQVNAFERNPVARQKCIAHYGTSCVVCGFNFAERYGSFAENYIHVHHLKPLASIGGEYVVDPVKDLRPVCANCHAVIHLQQPPLSIEDVKNLLKTTSACKTQA